MKRNSNRSSHFDEAKFKSMYRRIVMKRNPNRSSHFDEAKSNRSSYFDGVYLPGSRSSLNSDEPGHCDFRKCLGEDEYI